MAFKVMGRCLQCEVRGESVTVLGARDDEGGRYDTVSGTR